VGTIIAKELAALDVCMDELEFRVVVSVLGAEL
jgi:hypothetical protein